MGEWKTAVELEQAQRDLKRLQADVARLTAERDRMETALWAINMKVAEGLELEASDYD